LPKIPVYFRYVAVSAAALAVDFSLFMLALSLGMAPALAGAFGYMMGIAAHWTLSSRVVFSDRLAPTLASRVQQQALFVGSALAGLAVTMTIVGIGSRYGYDPRLAKILAIAVSFNVTFLLRKKVVFA
jgi:putative flippase GtrA